MYAIGNHVQFTYDGADLHGVIVPFTDQGSYDHTNTSYLVALKGIVDSLSGPSELSYYGWQGMSGGDSSFYLWLGHADLSLMYYHPPPPPRPVSPVFYMVKEAT